MSVPHGAWGVGPAALAWRVGRGAWAWPAWARPSLRRPGGAKQRPAEPLGWRASTFALDNLALAGLRAGDCLARTALLAT